MLRPLTFHLLLLFALASPAAAAASESGDPESELETLLASPVYGHSRFTSAAKREQDIAAAPGAVVVRTAGEIRTHGYRTLAEVLDSMPGIQIRNDRAYSYAGVRGATRPGDYTSRLLLLVDGARFNDALYDSASLDRDFAIDVSLIDRVEFTPGPGSALYGTNALAGVINVITRNAAQVAGTQLSLETGSFGNRKGTALWGGGRGEHSLLLGIASERRPGGDYYAAAYDAPETNGGHAVGRDGERSDKLFAKFTSGGWRLSAAVSQRTKDIPTGAYEATFNRPMPWKDGFAAANLSYESSSAAGHEWSGRIGVARYLFDSRGDYGDTQPLYSINRNDARWSSGELRYAWTGWKQHRVGLGIEVQRNFRQSIQLSWPQLGESQEVHGQANRIGVYLNDEWQPWPSLTVTTGVRLDRSTGNAANLSPRLAAVWNPGSQWTFKAMAGQSFREPNFSETDYEDSFQRRPQGLKSERAKSLELVALWRPQDGVSLSSSVYRSRTRDVIELMGQGDDTVMYGNRGRVHAHGAEFELTVESDAGVQWRSSYAWQRAHDALTGRELSNAANGLAKMALTAPGVLPSTRLGVNLVGIGPRTTLTGARLPWSLRLNAHVSWQPLDLPWNASFGVYNLTDRRLVEPGGPEHRQDTLLQPGREWRLQLGRTF